MDNSTTKNYAWQRQRFCCIWVKEKGRYVYMDMQKKHLTKLRESIFDWAAIAEKFIVAERLVLIGLTYDTQGTLVKSSNWEVGHIGGFIHALRQRMLDRLIAYAWVAELQKNGHMHYHLALYFNGYLPLPDKDYVRDGRKYKRLWVYGNSHVNWKTKNPYYLAQYVGKEHQKNFMDYPKKARTYSVWFKDKSLMEKLRDLRVPKSREIFKQEGWSSGNEFMGSGYKLEYLKTLYPNEELSDV